VAEARVCFADRWPVSKEDLLHGLGCRAIAAQFMDNQTIALFELTLQDDDIKVVEERHYRLVPANKLDQKAIRDYRD
jgi:hypothetical protein